MEFKDQLQNILEVIKNSGWAVKIQSRSLEKMPIDIAVFKDELKIDFRIYTWSIVKSGRVGERKINWRYLPRRYANPNSGDTLKTILKKNAYNLLIGQSFEFGDALFALFDPSIHHEHLESDPIQIKLETLEKAHSDGFALQHKNTGDITIVFKAENLMQVILGLYDLIFKQNDKDATAEKILQIASSKEPVVIEKTFPKLTPRERIAALRAIRDPGFRMRVLNAYENKCAVCGIDLNFLIAAHIISVGQGGSDETINGIALCPNHHEAFDMGLIGFNEKYEIIINQKQLDLLICQTKQASIKSFFGNVREIPLLPRDIHLYPPPEYLKKALDERMISKYIRRSELTL